MMLMTTLIPGLYFELRSSENWKSSAQEIVLRPADSRASKMIGLIAELSAEVLAMPTESGCRVLAMFGGHENSQSLY